MNLGAFGAGAQGFVQGWQSQQALGQAQQRIDQNQQQLDQQADIQNRQMAISEQDAADRQDQIDRQKQARAEVADAYQKLYGPQQVQTGTTEVDDGNGGTKSVPVYKTVNMVPGMDPQRDQQLYMAGAAANVKYSNTSLDDLAKIHDRVDAIRQTENGKVLSRLIGGDDSALPQAAAIFGKDPKGAKVQVDPFKGIYRINYADGTSTDLSRMANGVAAADFYADQQRSTTNAQGAAKTTASIDDLKSQSNLRDADAWKIRQLTPAELSYYNSKSNLNGAKAGAVAEGVQQSRANQTDNQALKEIKAVLERNPNSADGKGINTDQAAYLQGRESAIRAGTKLTPAQSVAQANAEWTDVSNQATGWVNGLKLSKDELKAKFGTSNKDLIRAAAIRKALSQKLQAAPAAPTGGGNLMTDTMEE